MMPLTQITEVTIVSREMIPNTMANNGRGRLERLLLVVELEIVRSISICEGEVWLNISGAEEEELV